MRRIIWISFALVSANVVFAQEGVVEYGAETYRGFMDASDDAGELLLSFPDASAVRAGMPTIAAAMRRVGEEACSLEKQGVPVMGSEMHPNDFELFGVDEPSVFLKGQVHIIQLDNNLANEVFELLENDCSTF